VRSRPIRAFRGFAILFTAIVLSTGAVLAAAWAAGDLRSLPGVLRKPSDLAPRCYEVMWGRVDSLYAPSHLAFASAHVPRRLFLGTRPVSRAADLNESWFELSVRDSATDSLSLRSGVQFAGWKPAGSDSIDVRLEIFPMTVRLRLAQAAAVGPVRALITWDTPGTQPAVVEMTRVRCEPG
jgi:hypothetical protein